MSSTRIVLLVALAYIGYRLYQSTITGQPIYGGMPTGPLAGCWNTSGGMICS